MFITSFHDLVQGWTCLAWGDPSSIPFSCHFQSSLRTHLEPILWVSQYCFVSFRNDSLSGLMCSLLLTYKQHLLFLDSRLSLVMLNSLKIFHIFLYFWNLYLQNVKIWPTQNKRITSDQTHSGPNYAAEGICSNAPFCPPWTAGEGSPTYQLCFRRKERENGAVTKCFNLKWPQM